MVGQSVAHYRIVDRLGAGGMGVVYKAEDLRLGRVVALKFLSPDLASSPTAVERFLREARTASSLNHPNICTIYSIEESEGQRFLAMELLDGRSLAESIGGQPMAVDRAIDLALQIADALDAAHAQGVLHRDIKPANIFVTKRGLVKVLDFGLAKIALLARDSDARDSDPTMAEVLLTTEGLAMGTAAYMAPEQARGEPLDARSDIFSYGLVLYEMLTGQQAFSGRTSAVVFDAILNRDPAPLTHFRTDLPPELEHIVEQAIDKDPVGRFQSMAELKADLLALKRARDSGMHAAMAAAAPEEGLSDEDMPTVRMPRPSGASRTTRSSAGPSSSPVPPARAPSAPPASVAVPPAPLPVSAATVTPDTLATALLPATIAATAHAGGTVATATASLAPPVAPTSPSLARERQAVPPRSGPKGRSRVGLMAGAVVVVAALGATVAWRMRTPAAAVNDPAPSAAPAPASLATNEAAQSALEAAGTTAVPADVAGANITTSTTRPAAPRPATPPAAAPAATPAPIQGGAIVPVLPRASAQRIDPAALLLTAARTKYDSHLLDQARADVQTILRDHAASPAAAGAWLLSARIDTDQGRPEDAIAALTRLRNGFADDDANAEGSVRLGQLLERTKRPDRVTLARQVLGEVPARFADSPWAPRALAQKALLETRERVKDTDPVLGSVPAAMLSHRALVEKYPTAPEAEFSGWQLASFYEDRKQYDKAAAAYAEVATRFPGTRYDAWWRAAEIYDRRLDDAAAARAAYARVPTSSPKYKDAQKRAAGR